MGSKGGLSQQGLVAGGLDVVVRVEGDGARAGRPVAVPDDGGPAALPDDLDVEALRPQQLGDRLGAGRDVGLVEGVEGDARDTGQRLEVGAHLRHQLVDPLAQGGDLVGGEDVGHVSRHYRGGVRAGAPVGSPAAAGRRPPARAPSMGAVFGRSRTEQSGTPQEAHPQREGAKNRPTPKRREREAARRQPLVQADRKQARQQEKAKRSEQLALTRQAMVTGDERHLPPRDKGPVRRYIRDYVDARWNLAEFMLPVMVLVLALSFLRYATVLALVTALTYGIILVAVADTFFMWRRCRSRLVEKFGADKVGKGGGMYAAMRAFQMRRFRMPRAMVDRGAYPT